MSKSKLAYLIFCWFFVVFDLAVAGLTIYTHQWPLTVINVVDAVVMYACTKLADLW